MPNEPTYEELKARLAQLEKEKGAKRSGALDFRVGEKGGVSVYGLGRFPVTLYYEQWVRLLDLLEMNAVYEHCSGVELFTAGGRRILDH